MTDSDQPEASLTILGSCTVAFSAGGDIRRQTVAYVDRVVLAGDANIPVCADPSTALFGTSGDEAVLFHKLRNDQEYDSRRKEYVTTTELCGVIAVPRNRIIWIETTELIK